MKTKEDLRPTQCQRVMDVVDAVGISTADWSPKFNPDKLFNWCFGSAGSANVAFIWFNELFEENISVYFLNDPSKDGGMQGKRNKLNSLINQSYFAKKGVSVAIVSGPNYDDDHTKAKYRALDDEAWYPYYRDPDSGNIWVRRGVAQSEDDNPSSLFVSQPRANFPSNNDSASESTSVSEEDHGDESVPQTLTSLTTTYTRDPEVAKQAKQRASTGSCDLCGKQGFATARGGFYLEAHHVIPRNCDGPDEIWNVAAICADDHKRAHFGTDRIEVRDRLIEVLGRHYPERLEHLRRLAEYMDLDATREDNLEESAGS